MFNAKVFAEPSENGIRNGRVSKLQVVPVGSPHWGYDLATFAFDRSKYIVRAQDDASRREQHWIKSLVCVSPPKSLSREALIFSGLWMVEIKFVEGIEAADATETTPEVEEQDPRVELFENEDEKIRFTRFYGLFYVIVELDAEISGHTSSPIELKGSEMDQLIEALQRLRAIDYP